MPLLSDVSTFLAAAGLSLTAGTNLFQGKMPDSPDLCVALYEYAGEPSDRAIPVEHPGLQIKIRGDNLANGLSKAYAIHKAFNHLSRQTLTATLYYYSEGRPPEQIGFDPKGRPLFVLNYIVDKATE